MIQCIKSTDISELAPNQKDSKIHTSLNLLGLNLSEAELNELKSGNLVSLESRDLSEIGSLFILAAALSASNLGNTKKPITFGDLPKLVSESACCSGIPLSSWNTNFPSRQCHLYLTLVDGKPALQTGCELYNLHSASVTHE
jgi:hypothetical protein